MTTTMNRPMVNDRARWADLARNPSLPLMVRVCCLAEALAVNGHAPLTTGELQRRIDPHATIHPSSLSRAINDAVRTGWLDARSSARCLVFVGAGGACFATHRDGS